MVGLKGPTSQQGTKLGEKMGLMNSTFNVRENGQPPAKARICIWKLAHLRMGAEILVG
jgi:hypothetical protein